MKTLEYTDPNIIYDDEKGEHLAGLYVEYEPKTEDTSFDHAFGTCSQHHVTDIRIIKALIILDQGAVDCSAELFDKYLLKQTLIDHATKELENE